MVKEHPAARLFPPLDEKSFQALVSDIKKHGQQEPVYRYKGQILDGRNRLRACKKLGLEPWIEDLDPDECPDPYDLVMSENFHRRHLSPVESGRVLKAYLAAKGVKRGKGKVNQHTRASATVAEAAKTLGMSERTARSHLQAADDYEALPKQLKAKVDSGEITTTIAKKASELVERRVRHAEENGALPERVTKIFDAAAERSQIYSQATRWLESVCSAIRLHRGRLKDKRWSKPERDILVRHLKQIRTASSQWLKELT